MEVNIQVVFKAMRLDGITRGVSCLEEVQRLSFGALHMLRGQGNEEEPAETECTVR